MGNSSCVSCGECMVSCPTGALTNKSVVKTVLPGEPVDVDELQQLSYFQKVSGTFLELNKNAVVRRHFRKGEIVCREGEYGSTAFYILEGQAEVFLSTPMAHVKTEARSGTGFLSKTDQPSVGTPAGHRAEEGHRDTIPIDAPVDLPYDHPVATLGPGDLFGEMTCMSLYPRSATVRAATDCVMFEMLRNVLDIIQRNKTLKAQLDANYRQRALDDHLRSVPMFASLSQDFIDVLRNKVELVRYTKGDVICRQGDIADSFYLVRLGFVKVSEAASWRRSGAGVSGPRRIFRRDRPAGRWNPHGHLHRARSRGAGAHPRRRVPSDDASSSRTSARAWKPWSASVRNRIGSAWPPPTSTAAGFIPDAGPDGSAEPAGDGSGTLHALRCLRARLRRRARRRHPADPRRPALRQISGGHVLPPLPRSAVHGGVPGGLHPPPQFARSDHRELVHRLRLVRQELPVRQYQHASVQGDARTIR